MLSGLCNFKMVALAAGGRLWIQVIQFEFFVGELLRFLKRVPSWTYQLLVISIGWQIHLTKAVGGSKAKAVLYWVIALLDGLEKISSRIRWKQIVSRTIRVQRETYLWIARKQARHEGLLGLVGNRRQGRERRRVLDERKVLRWRLHLSILWLISGVLGKIIICGRFIFEDFTSSWEVSKERSFIDLDYNFIHFFQS